MKILLINSVCGTGSTGNICVNIAKKYEKEGHEVKIAYGRVEEVPKQFQHYAVRIGNNIDVKMHAMKTRFFDKHGFGSKKATKKFLEWAEIYNPDIIWLHNIHGYYINVEMLFEWIKKRPWMQVKWTLHDCWSFTGHCAHFVAVGCEQWKTRCEKCSQKNIYPASVLKDNCKKNYVRKKEIFTGVKNMLLITPSKWLANLTRESFLKEYPVEVHYNQIDTNIFKKVESDFKDRYDIRNKKMILGVAGTWTKRKGFYDFVKLAQMLDNRYVIVLVGISNNEFNNMKLKRDRMTVQNDVENVECEIVEFNTGVVIPKNLNILYEVISGEKYVTDASLPADIICIPKTDSTMELAEIYSAADIFVNPTYEDTFPTVNLEAKACGTKVITYNVGGCVETLQ